MFLNSFLSLAKVFPRPAMPFNQLSLSTQPQRSIVYRFIKQRSPFDTTNYIDNYIPPLTRYHKKRKPRLAQWDDPNVHWPPIMPRATKLQGRELLRSIETREKFVKNSLRPFKIPEVRPGDVIEFKYLFSISEHLGNILTGVVIGRRRPRTYNSSYRVLVRVAGEQVMMDFKEMCPLLVGLKIVARGSGNLRAKLNYLRHKDLDKDQYLKPVIKGRAKRRRSDDPKKEKHKGLGSRTVKLEPKIDETLL